MVDTRSNMQLFDLNYKHHGRKSLQDIIDCAIGTRFYLPLGSLHYQLLPLGQFHEPTHINCEQNKKSSIKNTLISSAYNCTTTARADQI